MSNKKNITKKYLVKVYVDNKKSSLYIAKIIGCSSTTVINYLKKYNILRRTLLQANKWGYILTLKFLQKEYNKNNKSILLIANEIGCNYGTVYKYLKKYKIKIKASKYFLKDRTRPEHSKKMSGKYNPNWQGGKSCELYPLGWNKTFKEQIRYRDKYKCKVCGCPEIECYRKLDIHHIDYDKENINPENLISLCNSCHSKTNFNRDYWINKFTEKEGGYENGLENMDINIEYNGNNSKCSLLS